MEQLMQALNRLKQPWVADPSAEGSDDYRIFLAEDKKKLRKAVKIIERAYEQANGQADEDEADSIIEKAESQVLYELGVSSIAHDWKDWDWEEDVQVLADLGIELVIAKLTDGAFRVRLKLTGEEALVRKPRKASKLV